MELNNITPESLNITDFVNDHNSEGEKVNEQGEKKKKDDTNNDPKRVEVTIILCKVLQCLLWDFNFRFTLLPHQIEAVFAVAGIKVSPLLDKMVTWDSNELSCLLKLDTRKGEGKSVRKEFCKKHIDFTNTRGLLLADAMGLGKTVQVRIHIYNQSYSQVGLLSDVFYFFNVLYMKTLLN